MIEYIDPEVLKNLKKHKKCMCLECGYIGLMGVEGIQKLTLSNYFSLAAFVCSAFWLLYHLIFYNYSFLWQIIYSVIIFIDLLMIIGILFNRKSFLYCPNCGKIVKEK